MSPRTIMRQRFLVIFHLLLSLNWKSGFLMRSTVNSLFQKIGIGMVHRFSCYVGVNTNVGVSNEGSYDGS